MLFNKRDKDDGTHYVCCSRKCKEVDFSQINEGEENPKCPMHESNNAVREALRKVDGSTKKAFLRHIKNYGVDETFSTIANFVLNPSVEEKLTGVLKKDFKAIRDAMKCVFKTSDGKEYESKVLDRLDKIEQLAS